MLRLRTFGGLALEGADGQLTGRAVQPRRLALLTLLATSNEGRGISRDTLQTLLWPESDADSARHSLYQALHVLRHDLADDLIVGSAELRLNPERLQADVLDFLAARRAGTDEQVIALYAGPFLQGFYLRDAAEFERWVESNRQDLARVWHGAAERLAQRALMAGDARTASGWWRRLADADPLDGTAALGLIRSLAAAGDRTGGLAHAERHARALDEELGVAPDPTLTAFCRELRGVPRLEPWPSGNHPAPVGNGTSHDSGPIRAPLNAGSSWRPMALAGVAVVAIGLVVGQPDQSRIAARATTASLAGEGMSERRLAVLPFTNLGSPTELYFVDGLRDEIASRLGTIPQIALIARTSVNEYRAASKALSLVADELQVEYVLTGSVSWAKLPDGVARIRVIPRLVRTSDGRQLWADRFESGVADVFAIQGQIAERVAGALGVALGTPERQRLLAAPTSNPAAYDAYLRANGHNERYYVIEDRKAALAGYQRAVALDPTFAAAFAQLASSHLRMYELEDDRTPKRAQLAKAALDRAGALAPKAVETRLAHADYENTVNGRPDRALLALRAAEREQPNHVEVLYGIARILTAQDKLEEAAAVYQRALVLDPRGSDALGELAHVFDRLHRYQQAIDYREQDIAHKPRNPGSYLSQAWSHLAWRGDTAAARRMLARGVDAAGRGLVAEDLARYGGVSSLIVPLLDSGTIHVLDTISRGVLALDPARFYLLKGQLFTLTGRPMLAQAHLNSARVLFLRELRRNPQDQLRRLRLAETYSALGLPDPIVPLAREIVSSLAESISEEEGFIVLDTWFALATAYVRAGQHEPALEGFAHFMRAPHHPTAAWVRADPIWDPLRSDFRFERVITETPPLRVLPLAR
jgi:DNA-binding SARP family transcriptional activator/TolB-like protein/Tfp pilus assembly protein PilF